MSSFLVRFALHFYNFCSLLNLELKDGKFVISNSIVLSNILKLPVNCIVLGYLTKFADNDMVEVKFNYAAISIFAKVSSIISNSTQFVSFFSMTIIQLINRRSTMRLINEIFTTSMDAVTLNEIKRNCISQSIGMLVFQTVLFVIQYFSFIKLSLSSLLMWALIMHQSFTFYAFISFAKNFEVFIVALLGEFQRSLGNFSFRHNERYFRRFQEIYALIEKFQGCFGLQTTFFVIFFLMNCIFTVSYLNGLIASYDFYNFLNRFSQ